MAAHRERLALVLLAGLTWLAAAAGACAKGEQRAGSTAQGGGKWSGSQSASSGDAGSGTGGAPVTTGTDTGGTSVTSASSSSVASSAASSASASSSSSGAGGGGAQPFVLLVAGGANALGGARFDGSKWTPTVLTGATNQSPGVTIVSGQGVGVYRDAGGGTLMFVTEKNGSWSAPAAVAAMVTTQHAPAIATRGMAADVVFHGNDFQHYFASWSGAAWSPTAEPVKPANQAQSFGPQAGALAAVGAELVLAYPGNDGNAYAQSRQMAAWQTAIKIGAAATKLTPALTAMNGGTAELVAVYVQASDGHLAYATRAGGNWAVAGLVEPNSYSADAPALAPLAGGKAVLAFRGLDGKGYTSIYTPMGVPQWSTPVPLAAVNPSLGSRPALAVGIGTAQAELAYAASDGHAYHQRLMGGQWSAAVDVSLSGQLGFVAIASAP